MVNTHTELGVPVVCVVGGGGGGQTCPPLYKNLFSQLCGAIALLAQDLSLSDFVILLILSCSFQWWRWIFPNWSKSKVDKTKEGSI